MVSRIAHLFFLLVATHISFAQTTEVRGKVIDGKTKEPLPFANVFFKGTITGTTTDEGGFYLLSTVEKKADSIVISYLGYPTKTVKIKRGTSQELNVDLGSENVQLKEVVVKDKKRKRYIDTTANFVFHKVVEHKNKNREQNIESYQFEEYQKLEIGILNVTPFIQNLIFIRPFRFVFDNVDTATVPGSKYIRGVIKEDLTDVYYRKNPKGLRRNIKATQVVGIENKNIADLATKNLEPTNVYDNLYVFVGKSFVAPFAPEALGTYRYFLTDTAKIEGRTTYKLHFVGITKADLALKGYAWIDSATWGVQSIYFRPNEKANLNFINDYSISQKYRLMNDSLWFLQKEELQSIGNILKIISKNSILIQRLYERRDIKLNVEFNDTLFHKMEHTFIAPNARSYSREYWNTMRKSQLNKYEEQVFVNNDSIGKMPLYKFYMGLVRFANSTFIPTKYVEFGRMYQFISRNNIEGFRFRLGAQTTRNFSDKVNFGGYGAYGLQDKKFKYGVYLNAFLDSRNEHWRLLKISYKYDMQYLGPPNPNPIFTFDNITTLLRSSNLTQIMRTREAYIGLENEWIRNFTSTISVANRTFYAIPGIFDFAYYDKNNQLQKLNNFNATEIAVESRIAPKDQWYRSAFTRYFSITKYPVINVNLATGFLERNNNVTAYQKIKLSLMQRLSWQGGHTRYQVEYAKIFGNAPYPISYITMMSYGAFFNNYGYNMTRQFEFVTDQYVSLYLEHHFDGLIFNKIPLVNKLGLREVFYFRGLWGTYSTKNADFIIPPATVNTPSKIPYMEASVGIENIFKVLRIDFMWRLTYRNTPGTANFAVKFAISPNF